MQPGDNASDGRVFGPFYPATLQPIVDHAERCWALVAIHELAPPRDEWAQAWLLGRSEEIARVASDIVSTWRAGETSDARAAALLDAYLVSLHEGLARHLKCASPACCEPRAREDHGAATDALTVDVPMSELERLVRAGDATVEDDGSAAA